MNCTVGAAPMTGDAEVMTIVVYLVVTFLEVTAFVFDKAVSAVRSFILGARSSLSAVAPDYILEGGTAVA